ncbi:MAG: dTDP-4-dehydrorhamnose reductase [Candidatus Krumholzibacteriia bacterium]
MRILVTGAAGMLGRAVVAAAGVRHAVVGADLADGDLTDPAVAPALLARHRPDWVAHCAAFTDVDGAESARERALAVNGEATAHLARACAAAGVGLQYISTDYVFDGRDPRGYDEEATRAPINHYGLTKARGEEAVGAMPGRSQIVRTSWLFGPGPKNFVLAIRSRLVSSAVLQVVKDQVGCPTYAPDLAEVLLFLLENGTPGLYHATNRGACTWFAFAREIARQLGYDPRLVAPCAAADWWTPARRPACSILRSGRLEALGCPDRPPWPDALKRYLALLAREEGVAQS